MAKDRYGFISDSVMEEAEALRDLVLDFCKRNQIVYIQIGGTSMKHCSVTLQNQAARDAHKYPDTFIFDGAKQ